jgi:hypothetical protein
MASRTGEVVASGHAATLTPIVLTDGHDLQSQFPLPWLEPSRALLRSLEVPGCEPRVLEFRLPALELTLLAAGPGLIPPSC